VRLESLSGGRFFQKPSFNPAENRRQGAGLGKMSSKEVPPACILKQVVDLGYTLIHRLKNKEPR
jgi:hypothetical protein